MEPQQNKDPNLVRNFVQEIPHQRDSNYIINANGRAKAQDLYRYNDDFIYRLRLYFYISV